MRVEINLPEDKKFTDKLKQILKDARRSRKNWIETLVVTTVTQLADKKTKQIP